MPKETFFTAISRWKAFRGSREFLRARMRVECASSGRFRVIVQQGSSS